MPARPKSRRPPRASPALSLNRPWITVVVATNATETTLRFVIGEDAPVGDPWQSPAAAFADWGTQDAIGLTLALSPPGDILKLLAIADATVTDETTLTWADGYDNPGITYFFFTAFEQTAQPILCPPLQIFLNPATRTKTETLP